MQNPEWRKWSSFKRSLNQYQWYMKCWKRHCNWLSNEGYFLGTVLKSHHCSWCRTLTTASLYIYFCLEAIDTIPKTISGVYIFFVNLKCRLRNQKTYMYQYMKPLHTCTVISSLTSQGMQVPKMYREIN